jgi:hypothetical protein
MNTKIMAVILGTTIGTMSSILLPSLSQQSFAYSKYRFDNRTQCVNITNLEFQRGLPDNATYMKLIDMCEHRFAANPTSP